MKTKYENFLEHLIHGLDEPKRTFMTHHRIGFNKDVFKLKGKLLSATKIFLSDDFVHKDLQKWNKEDMKRLDKDNTKITNFQQVLDMHRQIFAESLPIYDNLLLIYPFRWTTLGETFECVAGAWIRNTDEKNFYRISTFDNACKVNGHHQRLNLSLADYIINYDETYLFGDENGIHKNNELGSTKNFGNCYKMPQWLNMETKQFHDAVRNSYTNFILTVGSEFCDVKKFPSDRYPHPEFKKWVLKNIPQVDTAGSQVGIFRNLALLKFINAKGSETIAFKSHLPIKKRSNVIKGFEYKMLEVKKANRITTRYGDSINKNRLHEVRGHMRHYQSGKRTWIKSHQRGDEKMGIIIKDYKFQGKDK
jgi:hypothetical protein